MKQALMRQTAAAVKEFQSSKQLDGGRKAKSAQPSSKKEDVTHVPAAGNALSE
jgi:hypothetical protein